MESFLAGDVCRIDRVLYSHYFVASGNGLAIHNSKRMGCVVEETIADIAGGGLIERVPYISSTDRVAALRRMRSAIGEPYNLFSSNCEHFVRWVHGLDVQSYQVQKYTIAAASAAMAIKSQSVPLKIVAIAASAGALISQDDKSPLTPVLILGGVAFAFALGLAIASRA